MTLLSSDFVGDKNTQKSAKSRLLYLRKTGITESRKIVN